MNTIGLIGTGAAFLNYKKAKANYEALKEQYDALVAAVQTYNFHKYDEYYNKQEVDTKPFERPEGVMVSTILRVGNLVGKVFHAKPSVILSNTSDNTYFIHKISAKFFVFGDPIIISRMGGQWYLFNPEVEVQPDTIEVNKELLPDDTLEIEFNGGTSAVQDMDKLRSLICDAAGKKLITSCPKLSITGDTEKANVDIFWSESRDNNDTKEFWYNDLPGVLRYCGEAYYS